jgi:hypothetical protein
VSWLTTSRRRRPGLAARWRDLAYWLPVVGLAVAVWVFVLSAVYVGWVLFR